MKCKAKSLYRYTIGKFISCFPSGNQVLGWHSEEHGDEEFYLRNCSEILRSAQNDNRWFPSQKRAIFRKIKEIKELRGDVPWYIKPEIPKIDPRGICSAFHGAGKEIA